MQKLYLRWVSALLGASGLIALLFPFASGYDVADGWDWLGRLILPVVVFPFLILFGYIALLVAHRPPRWMNSAGYASAALLSAIAFSDSLGPYFDDFLFVALFTIVPAFFVTLAIRHGIDAKSGIRGLVALQSTYAVHLSLFLLLFLGDSYDIGYWLASLALIATMGQIVALAGSWWRITALFMPAAIMWSLFLTVT